MIHVYAGLVTTVLAIVAGYAATLKLAYDEKRTQARKWAFRAVKLEATIARQRAGISRLVDINTRDIRNLTLNSVAFIGEPIITFEEDE
jgi:hypothetical protein